MPKIVLEVPEEAMVSELVGKLLEGWSEKDKEELEVRGELDPLLEKKNEIRLYFMFSGTGSMWRTATEPTRREVENGEAFGAKMEIALRERLADLATAFLEDGDDKKEAIEKAERVHERVGVLGVLVMKDFIETAKDLREGLEMIEKSEMQEGLRLLFKELNNGYE